MSAYDEEWHIRVRNSEPSECLECDGTGVTDCGRDWQEMRCPYCKGSGIQWTRQDEEASIADALNDELVVERAS